MPFDEAITLTKINELNQKNSAVHGLKHDIQSIVNSLHQLLDVQERDKEADGTPKVDEKGLSVMIKVMPIDQDTLERLTTARRNTVFDKMIAAADVVLAKTV